MKIACCMAVALMMSVGSTLAEGAGKHLFILTGQSNMAGLDPGESFTPTVNKEFGADNVIVIKHAQGGQPIHRWDKRWKDPEGKTPKQSGDIYQATMAKVKAAIKGQEIQSVTFLWMQGERDARMEWGDLYEASLKRLIKQVSDDLDFENLNFVIGRISDYDMANKRYKHWTKIRDIQVKLAKGSPRGDWVDTDDLNEGKNRQGKVIKNDLHYSVAGYKLFGQRLAEKAIALINQ
ncbi:MAG: acetyl xylan esterase [Akkermansiaceae bacterium]|nr:acetyl xylan esterase [Akkermansiaceae bacterium]